nr:MAG TPA: hypothetical protein [Caudoviricetes sp.]
MGTHRTDCLTHWFKRNCLKVFSSTGFCLACSHATRTFSMGTVTLREGLTLRQTFSSVQSSSRSAP